jgi:hypothetical protein
MDDCLELPETQLILQSRMPLFAQAISQSVEDWRKFAMLGLDASARATIINQMWYKHALYHLESDKGVRICTDQNQRFLVVDDRIILRHKHLDGNLRSSNYPTPRAVDWNDNAQTALPNIPPCARLVFGYRLDATGIAIRDAFITFPQHLLNRWVWQIWGDPIDTFQYPLPAGIGPALTYAYSDYSVAV